MKVYAHIFYGKGGLLYKERFEQGLEPDASPYGFHNAEQHGWSVSFSKDAPDRGILSRALYKLLKFDLAHAFYNRKLISEADVVWTMTEREALAVAALFWLKLMKRRPIVGNAVWLLNEWHSLPPILKAFYYSLSKYFSVMTVHSKDCLPLIERNFPEMRSGLSYFGINDGIFYPVTDENHPDGRLSIFAAGNDRTRDWDTLLKAFGNDERFQLFIACTWLEGSVKDKYSNVKLLREPSMADFIESYRAADFVVIPMKPNIYSGITVALEAAAMRRPILSTRTGGVPTYFDSSEVLYVPAGDPDAMREAVLSSTSASRAALGAKANERFQKSEYTTKALANRYIKLTEEVFQKNNL